MHILSIISWLSLAIAFLCAIIISADEQRHPQKMWIMNIVWPVTGFYFSVFALWAYYRIGRGISKDHLEQDKTKHKKQEGQARRSPTWAQTAISVSHCGAGCTIGDIIAEFTIFGLGLTILGKPIYAEYAGDLFLAWLLGIVFQYFTIKPMRDLSVGRAVITAVKADTLSILTFEIGLFTWMWLTYFVFFPHPHLTPKDPAYWFMMQIGMVLGYFTAYPMNRLLIEMGWKEVMG